jgi:outer membrane protein OmpA-like peptidoglycan-associated protein
VNAVTFSPPGLRAVLAFASLFLALMLGGCASPATPKLAAFSSSYLVLQENADGSTGQVSLTTAQGETVLAKARQATRLTGPAGETFEASAEKINQDFRQAQAARPVRPVTYVLNFESGGSKLTPESELAITRILNEISHRDVPDVSVVGHTDTAGDANVNEKLGLERARLVAQRLAFSKLDPSKIAIESHGEKNLLVATPDDTPEPRNRRVEVTVR